MRPVLFEIPVLGWDLPGYGLALMIGFLLSIWWAAQRALKSGGDPDIVLNCGFIALIGGVVGSRVMYIWHYWDNFAYREDLVWALLDVRRGGMEVYGGVIAVMLGVFIYLRLYKQSLRWYLDILAPSAALGMGIGRIGCFLNGCCWGGVCDLPWAVQFPYGSSSAVQQWVDRVPGSSLPEELVFFHPTGTYPDGTLARPVLRELLIWSEEDLEAARQKLKEVDAKQAELRVQLVRAADAPERQRLQAEIQALERHKYRSGSAGCACAGHEYPLDALLQMERYDLSAAQLRELARQHPSLPVHPAQLYSTVTLLLLAGLLSALYWRRTRDGQVMCVFLLVEPLTRWLFEVIRADNPVDTLGAFTVSQFMAAALSALGLIGLLWLRRLPPRSPRAVLWEPPPEESAEPQSPKSRSGGKKRKGKSASK